MTSIVATNVVATNFGTGGKNLSRVQADTAQMNCHVSSVIYQIRDHGPAILDGEFYKDSSNTMLPGKAPAPAQATPACDAAGSVPVVSQTNNRGVIRVMAFSIFLLTVALISVGFYAWQQKMYVNDLQAELQIYDDLDKKF